jgi:hypothetical protein
VTNEELQAALKDAEESAMRSLRERDAAKERADQYRLMASEALARNPEVHRLKAIITQQDDARRLARLEIQTLKLEISLRNKQIKLLKQKKGIE